MELTSRSVHVTTLEAAFVLHRRPYQDNSQILDVFTAKYGRIALVANYVRGKKSSKAALLQPFLPVHMSWRGRSQLKNLSKVESQASIMSLSGDSLYCGFYLNELLCNLLPQDEPSEALFDIYQQSLVALAEKQDMDWTLRRFEWQLLQTLGYTIDFSYCNDTGEAIAADQFYRYHPQSGWHIAFAADRDAVSGRIVIAIANEQWQEENATQTFKQLLRLQISHLLGGRQLKSRELLLASRGQA